MNIGDRVSDYEIIGILGEGGMGKVFKVRNVLSDRIEAMKVLLPSLGANADLANRFQREIRVQAALDHPNIARLLTAQFTNDQLIMLMEFVEGNSIEQLLEQNRLGVNESVNYISQVLDALDYAHGRGVVHRDIKPANIMRTPLGVIKLMDFGIARIKQDQRLTQTGHAVGSLFYMSPEQIKGGEPDPRSDLYSLGVTLYEMVTGRRPFAGDSDFAIMAAHLELVPVAPIEVIPGIPDALNDVILRALAKDPEDRFQTAHAFRTAIMGAVSTGGLETLAPWRGAGTPPQPIVPPSTAPPYTTPAPPAETVSESKNPRFLYMALGSVATILALAAAVIEVPKLMHSAGAAPQTAPPVQGPAAQTFQPQSQPDPSQVVVPQTPQTPSPAPPPAVPTRVQVPAAIAPAVRTPQQPIAQPQQQPQAVVQSSPVQSIPDAPKQVTPAPSAELGPVREQYILLSARMSSAKTSITSLRQQLQSQGLNLRGDMLEAEAAMDLLMQEVRSSISAGDAEGARRNLGMAETAVQKIEKLLGR